MKNLIFLALVALSPMSFAEDQTKVKTVSFNVEYQIEYKKLTVDVICVDSFDAREDGDGENIEDDLLWFAPKDYTKTRALLIKGFVPELNKEKGEHCAGTLWDPGTGSTPAVAIGTYTGYVSNDAVKKAMLEQGKSFATREIVFKKSTFNEELLKEIKSTANDDAMSEIWGEK